MTLRCECGGVVEIENGGKIGDDIIEDYRCIVCGRTGQLRTYRGEESLTGCLTTTFGGEA